MSRNTDIWLYVIKDKAGNTRPFVINATDKLAAEDIAYEHVEREKGGDVITVENFREWVGPDCIELVEIGF